MIVHLSVIFSKNINLVAFIRITYLCIYLPISLSCVATHYGSIHQAYRSINCWGHDNRKYK